VRVLTAELRQRLEANLARPELHDLDHDLTGEA